MELGKYVESICGNVFVYRPAAIKAKTQYQDWEPVYLTFQSVDDYLRFAEATMLKILEVETA